MLGLVLELLLLGIFGKLWLNVLYALPGVVVLLWGGVRLQVIVRGYRFGLL